MHGSGIINNFTCDMQTDYINADKIASIALNRTMNFHIDATAIADTNTNALLAIQEDPDKLYAKIKQLEAVNRELRQQLEE